MRASALLICVASFLSPVVARASSSVELEASVGGGIAAMSPYSSVPAITGEAAADIEMGASVRLSLGGHLSYFALPSLHRGAFGGLSVGVRQDLAERVFIRGLVGPELSTACANGDFCGAIGLSATGELGVVVVQTTSVRAIVLARLFGTRVMGNGGVMTVVAPTAQLGLQF